MPAVFVNGLTINEVGFNVFQTVDYNGDANINENDQYVEIYNSTGSPINLDGYELWVNGLAHTFTSSDIIQAGGYFTIVDNGNTSNPIAGVTAPFAYANGSGFPQIDSSAYLAIYDPGTNSYITLSAASSAGGAPEAGFQSVFLTAHPGATQIGATEPIGIGGLNPTAAYRVNDSGDTWAFGDASPGALNLCFAAGTLIAADTGETAVEALKIGNLIQTAEGRLVPVRWIGRQTLYKSSHGAHMQPVRIRAGALGGGLPHSDLTVTADHGMVLDGYVINASTLINGNTIDFVPLAELEDSFTVYHIETEGHDVILANGAPSETFIDAAGRSAFDNHPEYLDLYGVERIIPEMTRPRISSRRLLPRSVFAQLRRAATVEMREAG